MVATMSKGEEFSKENDDIQDAAKLKYLINTYSRTQWYNTEQQESFNKLFQSTDVQVWRTKNFIEDLFSVFRILTESNRDTVLNVAIQLMNTQEDADLQWCPVSKVEVFTETQLAEFFPIILKRSRLGVLKSEEVSRYLEARSWSKDQRAILKTIFSDCWKAELEAAQAEVIKKNTAHLLQKDFVSIAKTLAQESKTTVYKPAHIPLNKDQMTKGLNDNATGGSPYFVRFFETVMRSK